MNGLMQRYRYPTKMTMEVQIPDILALYKSDYYYYYEGDNGGAGTR